MFVSWPNQVADDVHSFKASTIRDLPTNPLDIVVPLTRAMIVTLPTAESMGESSSLTRLTLTLTLCVRVASLV